ncbi:MAG: carbohydrate-binding protein [Winogradskyella sp.]|uniref:Ig-like domain-containing protein n=1 Tax=Winogradskyella sp. TaxID=1883156 RepID=UPI000F3DB5EA|nr:Ig-like domain-containing protein [Winogradskyella sp.]RNC84262.1 MAG: carbohydrate-binding protein [Winogradskyella sp.]
MKTKNLNYTILSAIALIFTVVSCDRDISDDAVLATFPNTAEVYTDNPVGLTDEFFISFDPAGGANTEGFGTDDNVAFEGTSSIRIDVPASNDPNGSFIGGIFRDRGNGRNLTEYDALTFYARGSVSGTLGEVGFGTDFLDGQFPASRSNIQLTTTWQKYIIPIPDASKLVQEKGMFLFAAGGFDILGDGPNGNEVGWTFWLDEIRFETLGTNLLVEAEILNGQDQVIQSFVDTTRQIDGTSSTFNTSDGQNITVNTSPSYFDYESSNSSVATVDETGLVTVVGSSGTTTINATLQSVQANGSIELTSNGVFPHAPIPPANAQNVVSLFSDAYTNEPVRHYNGFFLFATTQGGAGNDPNNVDISVDFPDGSPDNIINYTQLNFVSIGTYETVPLVDVSATTHLHIDINIRENVDASDFMRISLESGTFSGGPVAGGDFILNSTALSNTNSDGWLSLDIPLSSFSGAVDFSSIGQLFFVSDGTISDIWVDNVYFYSM